MNKKIKASRILIYVVLIGGVLIAVFPFIWKVEITSIMTT